jgi:hypothetical protein
MAIDTWRQVRRMTYPLEALLNLFGMNPTVGQADKSCISESLIDLTCDVLLLLLGALEEGSKVDDGDRRRLGSVGVGGTHAGGFG